MVQSGALNRSRAGLASRACAAGTDLPVRINAYVITDVVALAEREL